MRKLKVIKRRWIAGTFAAAAVVAGACSSGSLVGKPGEGVNVGESSSLRKLVPAKQLEASASQQYRQILQKAGSANALVGESDPQLVRLRKIAAKITPHARRFNGRASSWTWEVNLVRSEQINAFCMPGGKIAFYTGILEKLKLTDDEVAVIMGHEIAHALREHARAQIAKKGLTNTGAAIVDSVVGGTAGNLARTGAGLLSLKYSRDDETDADLVGLELAARAGYNPRAGVSLWKKMSAASKGAPMEWFSTHPASSTRIATIERNLPAVMPLYQSAAKQ